jgi:CheY-like chemotaxis protein
MANTNVILIAEDNPIIRHALVLQLRQIGHEPHTAADGLEALREFCEHHYALILMDINMPKCSGIEATILIRDHERKNRLVRTPIVAVTALPETRQECFSAGMDDFIIKPMLFERLRQLVDRWLPVAAD